MRVNVRCLRGAMGSAVVMLCFAGNIAGCAFLEPGGGPVAARTASQNAVPGIPPDIRSSDDVSGLLSYGALLRSLRAGSLEREHTLAADALAANSSAPNRIRVAMLLSLPGVSFQDNGRARGYLAQVLDEPGYNARQYRGLARFLLAVLDDRKQLESELADERRQRQDLQQKLDQLKAIEQDTGTRIPPKPLKEK